MLVKIHIAHPDHTDTVQGEFPFPYTRLSTNERENGIVVYDTGRVVTARQKETLVKWADEKVISAYEISAPEIRILAEIADRRTIQLSADYRMHPQCSQVVAAIERDGATIISTMSNVFDTSSKYHVREQALTPDEMNILFRAYGEYMAEIDAADKNVSDDTLGDLDAHPF